MMSIIKQSKDESGVMAKQSAGFVGRSREVRLPIVGDQSCQKSWTSQNNSSTLMMDAFSNA
jgi:hypothetical protein